MGENQQNPSGIGPDRETRGEVLDLRPAMVERPLEEARASRWSVRLGQFAQVLERSAGKRFGGAGATEKEIEEYFDTLHLADLALACGCMHGSEAAWDFFVENY